LSSFSSFFLWFRHTENAEVAKIATSASKASLNLEPDVDAGRKFGVHLVKWCEAIRRGELQEETDSRRDQVLAAEWRLK